MRVLIVGHGRMGRFHHRTITHAGDQAITLDPTAPADHTTWRTVPRDLAAAVIACPIEHLHAQTIAALGHGIPRVLIEKPAGATLTQALELHNTNPDLAVGYIERLNPVVALLAEHTNAGAHVTFTRNGPHRGPLPLGIASHDIDLHRFYFPGTTASIVAERSLTRQRTIEANGYRADLLTRTLHHPNGKITRCDQRDLLTEQWTRFRAGRPAALIADAVHVHRTLEDAQQLQQPTVEPIAA